MSKTPSKPTAEAPVHPNPVRPTVTPARICGVVLILAGTLLLVMLVSLMTGSGEIEPVSTLRHLLDLKTGPENRDTERTILFSIRLPRILMAAIVGAALSSAGVVFQALLRNPLADPYILGISGGAAVGAIVGILLGGITGAVLIPGSVSGASFLGALAALALLFGFTGSQNHGQDHRLLLTGVIINAFFSAAIMFLVAMSHSDRLPSILFWLMGDLSQAEIGDVMTAGIFLVAGFAVMAAYARPLNLLLAGEETARQLGVPVENSKRILLVAASVVTAVAVATSGVIGFVGLIVPHILRLRLGPDHRMLLPASVLFGAAFLTAADTVARTAMAPVELPVGVVTALCGAPYFMYLLHRRTC